MLPNRTFVSALLLAASACLLTVTLGEPCDIQSGQSNVILDIEESRGPQTNQSTRPELLPIVGNVADDITLEIASSSRPVFTLVDKQLKLISPLDRDVNDISSVILQVSCTVKKSGKRRNIPVIIRISDVNDNAPVFLSPTYTTTVPEVSTLQSNHPKDPFIPIIISYYAGPWADALHYSQ